MLPRKVADLYDLATADKWREARKLHFELLPINEALFVETNPGPVKFLLGEMGLCHPAVRLPLAAVSEQSAGLIRSAAKGQRLL